jgi:hypothetical protein
MYLVWQQRKNAPKSPGQSSIGLVPTPHDALEEEARDLPRVKYVRRPGRPPRPPSPSLVAIIVESHRVGGRPRQKLLSYVGSIQCSAITSLSARRRFWTRADATLEEFGQEPRQKLERALETKVRRPTAEEVAAASPAAARAWFDAFRAARAAQRSIEVQGPKPSTVPAPATRTDLGREKIQVKRPS